jgi:hypothetical protein
MTRAAKRISIVAMHHMLQYKISQDRHAEDLARAAAHRRAAAVTRARPRPGIRALWRRRAQQPVAAREPQPARG